MNLTLIARRGLSTAVLGFVLPFAAVAATPEERLEALRARAREIVGQMTLDEKISQLMNRASAVPRLGIAEYDWWNEALHGVARNGKATVFPEPIGLAASFDPSLVKSVAAAIADEARVKYEAAQSIGRRGNCTGLTFWSPNVNIFRDPRWGRGMETWGEDPYLTSRLGVAFVRGLQGDDPVYLKAAACAKHYAVHSGPESLRHSFDVAPCRRDLYETYLPAFRALVQEGGVEAVMGAYNRVYGESASASPLLLKDILRGEFGFKGHVVSDCGAVSDIHNGHALEKTAEGAGARALNSGLDIECGGSFGALRKAVEQKLVDEKTIDEAVVRMFTTRLRLGILEPDPNCPYRADPAKLCSPGHVALARRAARESMVLLKNDGVLPLDEKKLKSFSVMGAGATDGFALMGNYYGFSPGLVTYLEGFADVVSPATGIHYWPGYYYGMPADRAPGVWVEDDVVIAVVGLTGVFEGEEGDSFASSGKAGDRATLELPAGQLMFLRNLRRSCDNRRRKAKLVTVITGGSPVATGEIFALSDAVVMAWYGGQEGGHALADLLFGKADFTARLPVTFPVSEKVLPPFESYSMEGRTYRYQKDGIGLPFGYGLSYANCGYREVKVADDARSVSVRLENSSERNAVETVQIYVETPNSGRGAPLVSLRGFAKVAVPAKSSVTAVVPLDRDAFTEVGSDGRIAAVAGRCRVIAASAAPCDRSRELGVRQCETVFVARPRLLFFTSQSCRRCRRLEKDVFSTQKWADGLGAAIEVERIDLSGAETPSAATRYGISRKGSFVLLPAGGEREAAKLEPCEDFAKLDATVRSACVGLDNRRHTPVKIILDTDMIEDFDDVGALACLHAMADAGECEILATLSSTRGNASVAAIGIINSYYGRSAIPLGSPKGIGVEGMSPWRQGKIDPSSPLGKKPGGDGGHWKYRKLAREYSGWVKYLDADAAPDANEVYRRILADAPDGSVVICSIGFLTNLRRLLETPPDAISPLGGRELVARKVKKWVAMACRYPRGKEYNSMADGESSRIALENWPTPIVFSDWQYGHDIYAGRVLLETDGPRNPVRDVFADGNIPSREEVAKDPDRWHGACFGLGGRSSWDETAVIAAVRGETSYFGVERGRYRMLGDTGENVWTPDEQGPHVRLIEKLPKSEVGKMIDELILRAPKTPGKPTCE